MLKFSLNKQTNKPKKKKKVRLEHPQQMCQMPNIWHTKLKKHLPSNVLYVPNFYHLCPYCCKFATVICNSTDTNAKPKNTILFDFSLSSHFFIWFFSLFSESVSLSQVPNSCSSFSHNRMQARRRRRRWPRKEERQLWLRQNRWWQPRCRIHRWW